MGGGNAEFCEQWPITFSRNRQKWSNLKWCDCRLGRSCYQVYMGKKKWKLCGFQQFHW